MHRRHRLTASADFQSARKLGRSFRSALLVLHARQNGGLPSRVGVTVGKRFGTAVVRNRFRRRIREVARRRIGRLAPGWDLVFAARSGAAKATFGELESAVEAALRRAGIFASVSTGAEGAGQ